MSNYCPIWVLKCVVAQVCFEFIDQGNGLNIISKKYLSGLNELYLDTELTKIDDVETDFLKICVDFNINEIPLKEGVYIANINSDRQIVICGFKDKVNQFIENLSKLVIKNSKKFQTLELEYAGISIPPS